MEFKPRILFAFVLLSVSIGMESMLVSAQSPPCEAHNREILRTLPQDNILSTAILDNEIGTGISFPWNDVLKEFGIKQAASEMKFVLNENQVSMRISRLSLLSSYYDYSTIKKQTDTFQAKNRESIEKSLQLPFYTAAIRVLQGIKAKSPSCGVLYLNLLDDSCLPTPNEMPWVTTNCPANFLRS